MISRTKKGQILQYKLSKREQKGTSISKFNFFLVYAIAILKNSPSPPKVQML